MTRVHIEAAIQMQADILYDSRWAGPHGIGRWATEVAQRVPRLLPLQFTHPLFHPLDPWRLSAEVRRVAPAAFFSPGFNAPQPTPGIPLVFTVHDLNYVKVPENTTPLKRAYFALFVRAACRRAARVLTVSEFSRQQIVEWTRLAPEKIVNVGAGVSADFSPNGERHTPGFPYVLFAGSQAPHKNFRRTAQAFAQSRAARSDVRLLVTGHPTDDTRQWLEREKLWEMVKFAGVVPGELLPSYYRGALALLMPSLFEGFGLPVVEAMASGIPVLTSNRTSLPEVAGDAALLVDPTDVGEIAAAIDRLVFDDELGTGLRERGLLRAGMFSWDKTAAAVSSVLQEATSPSR